MKIYRLFPILLLSLVACSNFSVTPEQAVQQDLIRYNDAVPDSVRIYQSQPWRDSRVVLASFISLDNYQPTSCEAVYQMVRNGLGWRSGGSGIGCSNSPSNEDVTFGTGTQGVAPDEFSYAYGLVKLAEARWVNVTWQDGSVNRAPLVNDSFLALREGSFPMIARVEVLDATETIIHEIEIMPEVKKIP
jgi:hypothetical protein